MLTKELLEEVFIPGKIEQTAKILSWFDQGLLEPRGVLKYCLQFMTETDVDNLVALVEPELEDTNEEEDRSWYLEQLLEQLPPRNQTASATRTFANFQF